MEVALNLDLTKIEADQSGVVGFVWPIAPRKFIAVRDALFAGLLPPLRERLLGGDEDVELVSIVLPTFVREVLAGYYARGICTFAADTGRRVVPGAGDTLLPALLEGRLPSPETALRPLRAGVRRRTLRGVARRVRACLRGDPLGHRALGALSLDRVIVSCDVSGLIRQHASLVTDRVNFCPLWEWFGGLAPNGSVVSENGVSEDLVMLALDATRRAFQAGDQELDDPVAGYLSRVLREATGLARHYLDGVCARPERLPPRLWSGSGGLFLSRILRHAVRRHRGHVTGHDHGTGNGQYVTATVTLGEFESCDRFVALGPRAAEGIRERIREEFMLQDAVPEVTWLGAITGRDEGDVAVAPARPRGPGALDRRAGPPRVIHVGFPFIGERNIGLVLMFDCIAADWYARLFSRLTAWGFEVLHKPHPEGSEHLPKTFFDRLGVARLDGMFDNVYDIADIVLFDWPCSSPLKTSMAGGKPIVLVDFELVPFRDHAKTLMERRCAMVRGWFDEATNRAMVDWEALEDALRRAPRLTDGSFAANYFGV